MVSSNIIRARNFPHPSLQQIFPAPISFFPPGLHRRAVVSASLRAVSTKRFKTSGAFVVICNFLKRSNE